MTAEELRNIRFDLGLSQEEFGAHSGYSADYIQKMETGRFPVSGKMEAAAFALAADPPAPRESNPESAHRGRPKGGANRPRETRNVWFDEDAPPFGMTDYVPLILAGIFIVAFVVVWLFRRPAEESEIPMNPAPAM